LTKSGKLKEVAWAKKPNIAIAGISIRSTRNGYLR